MIGLVRSARVPMLGLSFLALAAVLTGPVRFPAVASSTPPIGQRPNVLLMISDDQSWTTFGRDLMPTLFSQLVDRGVLFTRAYVNTSLCCPSRSEIMTGLYQHHTGVDNNGIPLTRPTIIQALQDSGYRTMLSGKYLNSYDCAPPLREFDRWVCADEGSPYKDPVLNVDGVWGRYSGYTSDLLAEFAASFIAGSPVEEPFFVMYTPKGPHLPANDDRCSNLPVDPYRPPSFDEDTAASGKPAHMLRGPLSRDEIEKVDKQHAKMTQAVACLDPAVGTLLAALGKREADTLVFFLSDNGYLYGEHRVTGKRYPYEESMGVPFVVRYPPLVPEGQPFVSNALVQNVDIAATIAELAAIPWGADGKSLVPLLSGQANSIRDGALLEHCQASTYPCRNLPSFNAVATADFKYVEYVTGERELYDLGADPYEIPNLAGQPEWADEQAQLASLLAAIRAPPAPETTIVTGPRGPQPLGVVAVTYFSQSKLATYRCRLGPPGNPGKWIPCPYQSTTVGPLKGGDYVFEVAGVDEDAAMDPTPATRAFSVVPATTIQVADFNFSPSTLSLPRGGLSQWAFDGPSDHTATDASGMGLFDSGPRSAGTTYSTTLLGSGTYRYNCTIHPAMTGTLGVPIDVWPAAGNVGDKFEVDWAAKPPPAGFVFDVQVMRPGSSQWRSWLFGDVRAAAPFLPDSGPGSYAFRARLRRVSGGHASGYSVASSIAVSPRPGS